MTKLDQAIEALRALPNVVQDEVADIVLEIAEAEARTQSTLTPEQQAEVRRRLARGFIPGDPNRIDALLKRLSCD